MAATVSQVLTGLSTSLATISGLRTFAFQPDSINPPTAFPQLNAVTYHGAFQGGDVTFDLTIFVIVGRFSDRLAQTLLDDYLSYSGTKSIRSAIESDRTLGGVVNTLLVSKSSSIRGMTIGESEYMSIETTVVVHG